MGESNKITNHGIIEELVLPDGFKLNPDTDNEPNKYKEFQGKGSLALICYEETNESFSVDDIMLVEKLLSEDLGKSGFRELNLDGDPNKGTDDSSVFNVISMCFVFGGYLTRNGTVMDIEKCTWSLKAIGEEGNTLTSLVGHMKFSDSEGRSCDREVLLVMPRPPYENGCGYIWLEGNSSEIRRYQRKFLTSVSQASFT